MKIQQLNHRLTTLAKAGTRDMDPEYEFPGPVKVSMARPFGRNNKGRAGLKASGVQLSLFN